MFDPYFDFYFCNCNDACFILCILIVDGLLIKQEFDIVPLTYVYISKSNGFFRPKKEKKLVSGYPTVPNILGPTQTFLKTFGILKSIFRLFLKTYILCYMESLVNLLIRDSFIISQN